MRIIIDGWTGTPHSYAIVNEAQIAAMKRHGGFEIVEDEREAEVAYRIRLPIDLRPAEPAPTFVFATPEFFDNQRVNVVAELLGFLEHGRIITPSHGSRDRLIAIGAEPERVTVVPHGVDKEVFRVIDPSDAAGPKVEFIYVNVSTQDQRKGTDILLRAFAIVARAHPVRLILKGLDHYSSGRQVEHYIAQMRLEDRRAIAGKVQYIGRTMSRHELAALYRSADCYVTPYRAEAFNMPALEALACGLPIICTAGGPTEAFIEGQVAARIEAKTIPFGADGQQMIFEPDEAHLASLMVDMLQHPERRQEQAKAAFKCTGWDAVAVQLHDLFSRHI